MDLYPFQLKVLLVERFVNLTRDRGTEVNVVEEDTFGQVAVGVFSRRAVVKGSEPVIVLEVGSRVVV